MTAIDPYRTLGLAPGASQAEIKRAYRQLAKLYHPDSAGERAIARFLAIQAAYEALVDEPGRPRPGAGRGGLAPVGATAATVAGRRRPGSCHPGRLPGRELAGVRREPREALPAVAGDWTDPPAGGRPGGSAAAALGRCGRGRTVDPAAQGHDRVDQLRRGRGRAVHPALGGGHLVRRGKRHVLDAQPEGVRRPAQARPRVPGPIATRERLGPGRRAGRRRDRRDGPGVRSDASGRGGRGSGRAG